VTFPDAADLRPTPDRVRETLFNWLGQDLTGAGCLDLFAGSGVLGFEAASRGARLVVMVERDAAVFRTLESTAQALQADAVELVHGDALEFLASDARTYDIVFLDPPYAMRDRDATLRVVRQRLAADAQVYLETPARFEAPAGWEIHRSARAGGVHYQLLRAVHG
jgi:16S rRNA (guanine(966)-N(2))-methyltransferase RsmD